MNRSFIHATVLAALLVAGSGCSDADPGPLDPPPGAEPPVLTLPIVVHIVHRGEPVGHGANLSRARIEEQLRILNEDFRRIPGSPGFNTHPDGNDARIQFALAEVDPSGSSTSGVRRVRYDSVDTTSIESLFERFARYGYWDPERYINVWTMPLAEEARGVFLGKATGPETDLPGAEFLLKGEPYQPEGILVNADHFGRSFGAAPHGLGRTLTHEMGHYLGLLHLWGDGTCENNDFCSDTPPVASAVWGCSSSPVLGCDGRPAMVENYMSYADDACMNVFTNDQIARMRYVLERSPRRRGLGASPGLER